MLAPPQWVTSQKAAPESVSRGRRTHVHRRRVCVGPVLSTISWKIPTVSICSVGISNPRAGRTRTLWTSGSLVKVSGSSPNRIKLHNSSKSSTSELSIHFNFTHNNYVLENISLIYVWILFTFSAYIMKLNISNFQTIDYDTFNISEIKKIEGEVAFG